MKKLNKKQISLIVLSVVLVVVASVSIAFIKGDKVKIDDSTTTTTEENTSSTTTTTTTEESSETSTKTQENDTTEKKETTTKKNETTTKKQETTTKKPVTTTKKAETTTKKPVSNKPDFEYHHTFIKDGVTYYWIVDSNDVDGGYYTDKDGIVTQSKTWVEGDNGWSPEDSPSYDGSYCLRCGQKGCCPAMQSYYCKICKKEIPAHECHPETHFDASH